MSQSFIEAERNYDIYDRELLAIIKALKEWQHYLEGSPHALEILSDHKNLEVFRHASKLSYRQAHWAEFLSRFSFTIQHISGKKAGKPDALSRRPDHYSGHEDNEDRILLPSDLFASAQRVSVSFDNPELLQRIKDAQQLDPEVLDVLRYILAPKSSTTRTSLRQHWSVQDGLIFSRGRIYIPKDDTLRRDLVQLFHDLPAAGHPGRYKTYDLIRRHFFWPGWRLYFQLCRWLRCLSIDKEST